MFLVNAVEKVAAGTRAGRKLRYERKEQIVTTLLAEILKIEVKIGHDS